VFGVQCSAFRREEEEIPLSVMPYLRSLPRTAMRRHREGLETPDFGFHRNDGPRGWQYFWMHAS
jgi:hypothetical protein